MPIGDRGFWHRLRPRSVRGLPGRARRLVLRAARLARARSAFKRGAYTVGSKELRSALHPHELETAVAGLGGSLGVTGLRNDERRRFVGEIASRFPMICARIVASAEDACRHRFDLLGSGPVDLGAEIDWQRDFKSGFRWPAGFYADLAPVDLDNEADVKIPWELSRAQHFVTLGQAYWLTGDERYAREFSGQLRSWMDTNPVRGTINWGNAMEPAIRIVNWLWAAALFREAAAFTREDRVRFLGGALEHGRFILENLEVVPGAPASNHYLSDLVGLVYLGVLLPELREASRWLQVGLAGLVREIEAQVHPDGVDYEGSIGYHRFATEIFASAFALCRQNGLAVPESAWRRLARMLEFVRHYTRPDGRAPLIGDSDDGRLHLLTPAPGDDHRHLLGFGGALLGRPDLLGAAGELAHEAAWWFGLPAIEPSAAAVNAVGSAAFPDGGFYVLRHRDRYLIADCGHPPELTGHAHNDTLSFELAALGRVWIVDSGTYVYTASARWRNHFRSTSAHNTVMVDGVEMNSLRERELFGLGREAAPVVNRWECTPEHDLLDAQHDGYCRLPGGGVHRRRFYFDKRSGHWLVEDFVAGQGRHRVQAFLHFAPRLRVDHAGPAAIRVGGEGTSGLYVGLESAPGRGRLRVREDWVSRGYGEKAPAPVVELDMETELPVGWRWLIVPLADAATPALPAFRSIPGAR